MPSLAARGWISSPGARPAKGSRGRSAARTSATIVLTESTSGTTRTATADVTQRVLAFVNAGDPDGAGPFSPYQETHIQEDILLRLAVADDSATYPNTSVRIRDLELKTGGGAFESIIIDNDSDSDQAVNATDDTANRQVGLIFINDALTDHTTDMQMRGKLNFGYTRAGTAGGPPNGANIMFEVKLGDLDPATSDFGDLPDTSSSTGPGNYQTLAANSGPSHVLINGVRLGAAIDLSLIHI